MKHKKIVLGDTTVHLRLSALTLAQYAKDIGSSGNTLFAVMDALDDMDKQGALFSAALTFQGNENTVQSGFELIDMLADAEYGPLEIKELIVSLAADSGIISKVDAAKLVSAIKTGSEKLYDAAVAVLSGDMSKLPAQPEQPTDTTEENPT